MSHLEGPLAKPKGPQRSIFTLEQRSPTLGRDIPETLHDYLDYSSWKPASYYLGTSSTTSSLLRRVISPSYNARRNIPNAQGVLRILSECRINYDAPWRPRATITLHAFTYRAVQILPFTAFGSCNYILRDGWLRRRGGSQTVNVITAYIVFE